MTWHVRYLLAFGLFIAVLVTACSTTEVKSVWRDQSYSGHPRKIMVIGVSKNPVSRRIFEDEFVHQLEARGMSAMASYTVLPDAKQNDQAAIAEKLASYGADTVLITRLVSKKTVQVYIPGTVYFPPPYYDRWRDYYGYGYQTMYTPGYMAEHEYALIETNMYDAASDKLVWSASSETEMRGADQKLIKSYIGMLVRTMAEQNLLAKK